MELTRDDQMDGPLPTEEVDPGRHRTVVFIGRTGGGKSTCASVIAGSSDSDAPHFESSDSCASGTKDIDAKTVIVDWEDQTYSLKIVDTIGIGDTDLGHDQVLQRLATVCHECREGINALYFVIGGRVTDEEADAWDITWKLLFDQEIINYTTFIRCKFPKFMDPKAVADDEAKLKRQKRAGARIVPTMRKIIHVDNPPLSYGEIGDQAREQSRKILMTHLILSDKVYKPQRLDEVNERIHNHVAEKSAADQKVIEMEKSMAEARDELERLRIQAAVAEERAKAAVAETQLVRQMNEILKERRPPQLASSAAKKSEGSCSVM